MRFFTKLTVVMVLSLTGINCYGQTSPHKEPTDAAKQDKLLIGAQLCAQQYPALNKEYGLPKNLLAAIAATESGRNHDALGINVPWPWTITESNHQTSYNDKEAAVLAAKGLLKQGVKNFHIGCTQVPYDGSDLENAMEPGKSIKITAAVLSSQRTMGVDWNAAVAHYGNVYSSKSDTAYSKTVLTAQKSIQDTKEATRTKTTDIGPGCHFKTPDALMCDSSETAALVYQEYGFNSSLIRQSYSSKILHDSGCLTVASYKPVNYGSYKKEWKPVKIERIAHGKVAMPNGWIGVHQLMLTLDHSPVYPDNVSGKKFAFYVADDYISGTCPKTQN